MGTGKVCIPLFRRGSACSFIATNWVYFCLLNALLLRELSLIATRIEVTLETLQSSKPNDKATITTQDLLSGMLTKATFDTKSSSLMVIVFPE